MAFEGYPAFCGIHGVVHEMVSPAISFISSLPDTEERETCPERRGHCFLHPSDTHFINPGLRVTLKIIIHKTVGYDSICLQMQLAFLTDWNTTLLAKVLVLLTIIRAYVIFRTTQESSFRQPFKIFCRRCLPNFILLRQFSGN